MNIEKTKSKKEIAEIITTVLIAILLVLLHSYGQSKVFERKEITLFTPEIIIMLSMLLAIGVTWIVRTYYTVRYKKLLRTK